MHLNEKVTINDHLDLFSESAQPLPELGLGVVNEFEKSAKVIDSASTQGQPSNAVLAEVRPGLERLGFLVETSKTKNGRISVPVLFGRKGKVAKSFHADAHYPNAGWVIEVEAGRAVTNYQFLKDIFQACMMHEVTYLAIAVRNDYRGSDDFATIESWLETLYASGRLELPLKGILLIGY